VPLLASCIVLFFTAISLCGVKWIVRLAMPVAVASAGLAFLSAVIPVFSGNVDWRVAFTYHLSVPFDGWFGQLTSVMAGLYLIGFPAPAFEQSTCHVGETIDPNKNVPRAVLPVLRSRPSILSLCPSSGSGHWVPCRSEESSHSSLVQRSRP
jgi:amino acid transporter